MTVSAKDRAEALEVFEKYIKMAEEKFAITLANVELTYNIKGYNTAGRASYRKNEVQLNPHYFKTEDAKKHLLEHTVGHEVAHFVEFVLYGTSGHGLVWKGIMRSLGLEPSRCHSVDVESLGKKKRKGMEKFPYECGCMTHMITKKRINKMAQGVTYRCNGCKQPLVAAKSDTASPTEIQNPTTSKSTKSLSKKDQVIELIALNSGSSASIIISLIVTEVGMTEAGAKTYYYKYK